MTGPRLFILVLVVGGVLCAVGIGVGLQSDDAPAKGGDDRAANKPLAKALGGLAGRFGPKVKLDVKRWTLAGSPAAAVQTVAVPADLDADPGKKTYRTLTLRLTVGGPAAVRFVPRGEGDEQNVDLPRKEGDKQASLVVGAGGGTLTLTAVAPGGAPTVVEVVE